jgi:hypothetical protein
MEKVTIDCLECIVMEEVGIGLTEIAWNGVSHFWNDCMEWIGIEEDAIGLTGIRLE